MPTMRRRWLVLVSAMAGSLDNIPEDSMYEYWLFGATLRYIDVCYYCEPHYDPCLRCFDDGWYMMSAVEGVRV